MRKPDGFRATTTTGFASLGHSSEVDEAERRRRGSEQSRDLPPTRRRRHCACSLYGRRAASEAASLARSYEAAAKPLSTSRKYPWVVANGKVVFRRHPSGTRCVPEVAYAVGRCERRAIGSLVRYALRENRAVTASVLPFYHMIPSVSCSSHVPSGFRVYHTTLMVLRSLRTFLESGVPRWRTSIGWTRTLFVALSVLPYHLQTAHMGYVACL